MTLNDLVRLFDVKILSANTLLQHRCVFWSPQHKFEWSRPILSAKKM